MTEIMADRDRSNSPTVLPPETLTRARSRGNTLEGGAPPPPGPGQEVLSPEQYKAKMEAAVQQMAVADLSAQPADDQSSTDELVAPRAEYHHSR